MDSVIQIMDRLVKAFIGEKVTPHPTLKFHKKRGKNIAMDDKNILASRVCDFRFGMVFSQRPVGVNEPICVQILKKNAKWQGNLRIGFTHINPIHFDAQELEGSKMLQSICWPACCFFTSIWEIDFTFVTFRIKANGDIIVKVDDKEERKFESTSHPLSPTEPLWAAVDIYGSITAVQFVYHPMLMKMPSTPSSPSPVESLTAVNFSAANSQSSRANIFTFDVAHPESGPLSNDIQCSSPNDLYANYLQSPLLSPRDSILHDGIIDGLHVSFAWRRLQIQLLRIVATFAAVSNAQIYTGIMRWLKVPSANVQCVGNPFGHFCGSIETKNC